MSSTVKLEAKPEFEFVLKCVKTRGLKDNEFKGKKVPGKKISVQVDPENIEKIQNVWSALDAKKPTPFFGFNGSNNMLTIKAQRVSEKVRRSCVSKDGDHIYVDIKFAITDVFVDEDGSRHPQLRMLGLRKVDAPEDEFEVTEDF